MSLLRLTLVFALLAAAPVRAAERVWRPIRIDGLTAGAHGIFDPSLASADGGATLYMSFSAVDPGPGPNVRHVSTHLAVSRDRGRSWAHVTALNAPTRGVAGIVWHEEVSSLAYDAQAPHGARWLLLTHHYPLRGSKRRFEYGWIGLRRAATPQALAQASETKLFAGKAYKPGKDMGTPLSGPPAIRADRLHPELSHCVAFTEPGLLARADALYLAMGCADWRLFRGARIKVVLLKCARPCILTDRAAWEYVATLPPPRGASRINAADLFESRRGLQLVVTPVSDRPFKNAYHGCAFFRVSGSGFAPADPGLVEGEPGSFNGACAIYEGRGWRLLLLSQLRLTPRGPRFTIQARP